MAWMTSNGLRPTPRLASSHPTIRSEWERWHWRRHPAAAGSSSTTSTQGFVRDDKAARLEAALFVAETPLSGRKLAQFATLLDAAEVSRLIDSLNAAFDASGSAFRVERVASGYQLMTRPTFSLWLQKLHQRQTELKLTPPQMETLTIIAYRQPITRADVEAVRGVQCAEMLKQLMDRGLVKIGGEDDSLGRPYLYVTTRRFLELYGLRSLDALPMADRLRKPASTATAAETGDVEDEAA